MASQERLSVDAAAERLGITPDAVRTRIKRGTLWAVRRNGRVQVVLKDRAVRGPGSGPPPTRKPTNHLSAQRRGRPRGPNRRGHLMRALSGRPRARKINQG